MPLLDVSGVSFYSLQKELSEADRTLLNERSIVDLSPHLGDLADTAAAIAQLDLVISVDTAVAHLAGALGKPVWILLAFSPDWRWLLEREDSPWYPSARLFRQHQRGDWEGVFARVAQALGAGGCCIPAVGRGGCRVSVGSGKAAANRVWRCDRML